MNSLPEFLYLEQLIRSRLNDYFPAGNAAEGVLPAMPHPSVWHLPLGKFILDNGLNVGEATLLLIALAPHFQPELFDEVIESKIPGAGNFPKLGGVRGKNSRSFLPTGETALFLLAGEDRRQRLAMQSLFGVEDFLGQKKILWLEEVPYGEPVMSGRIIISQDYIDVFLLGRPSPPHFNSSFPARLISEKRSWDSLVISDELQSQIGEIINWLKYNDHLLKHWGMGDRLKKGYRALFYGPPGTGKTLTAALLGNEMQKDVYKIDLSMVVSKYIGETEKNLELLFARAEDKGWILFFDEADALFGKRTSVRDANDKYANQEVSYLLQRIEDFNGLIILATNMKNNIDEAFIRRFNAILRFPFPEAAERKLIWKKSFPAGAEFAAAPGVNGGAGGGAAGGAGGASGAIGGAGGGASGAIGGLAGVARNGAVDLPELVKKYELAGGSIINVVHYAALKAVERSVNGNGVEAAAPGANGSGVNGSAANGSGANGSGANGSGANGSGDGSGVNHQPVIYLSDVHKGIQIELNKHGKPFTP